MKKGIICSSFDLLHTGHVETLKRAKEQCDYLVVCLNIHPEARKGKHKPIQTCYERYKQLQAIKYVDEILIYQDDTDLITLLQVEDYQVRFLGADYKNKKHIGDSYERKKGIEIKYLDRDHSLSTSELRRRINE